LVDARSGAVLCPVQPLDKTANADALRRRLDPLTAEPSAMPATGTAPLLKKMIADYAATGLPPAYLPTPDKDPS
jgi:putative transposase